MPCVGIVDVGSNTVRLSVVETTPVGAYQVRQEEKVGLRLGARLGPDRRLGPEAAAETARVLRAFAWAGAQWGVQEWLAVGTAAVRQASDGAQFLRTVAEGSGVPLRLLSGAEEAALGLVGALNTLDARDGFLLDIGGASTELTRFEGRRLIQSVSVPLGAVNASAAFALGERAAAGALDGLSAALDAAAGCGAPAGAWIGPRADGTLIGLGGTVRALAKFDRRRRAYPLDATHNYLLAPAGVGPTRDELAARSARERARLPGLAAERADLIVAGAAILAWAVARLQPQRIVVSGSGLREGLFYRRFLRDHPDHLFADVLEASSRNLVRLYGVPAAGAERRAAIAAALWEPIAAALGGLPERLATLVQTAGRLRGLGGAVSVYDRERHTGYLLREARLFGCDHRERLLLAAAAAFEGAARAQDALGPYAAILRPEDGALAVRMGLCVALAEAVDREALGEAAPLQVSVLPSAIRVITAAGPAGGFQAPATLAKDFRKWFGRVLTVSPAAGG